MRVFIIRKKVGEAGEALPGWFQVKESRQYTVGGKAPNLAGKITCFSASPGLITALAGRSDQAGCTGD